MLLPGLAGKVQLPNSVAAHLSNISVNRTMDLGDSSGFGDLGERTRVALLRDATGSAAGIIDDAKDPHIADLGGRVPATMSVWLESTDDSLASQSWELSFSALISAVRIGVAYAGFVTCTFDWAKSSGVITETGPFTD